MNPNDQNTDNLARLLCEAYGATPDAQFAENLLSRLTAELPNRRAPRTDATPAGLAAIVGVGWRRRWARSPRWIIGGLAAALILLAVAAGWWINRYPQPRAQGDYLVAQGSGLHRGSTVTSGAGQATLDLGGYVHVDLQPQTTVAIGGAAKAEQLRLESGQIHCRVDRHVGSFDVVTEVGTVSVAGTEFTVQIAENQGDSGMITRRLSVRVLAGSVLLATVGGQMQLVAGEEKTVEQKVEAPGGTTARTGAENSPPTTAPSTDRGVYEPYAYLIQECQLTDVQKQKLKELAGAMHSDLQTAQAQLKKLADDQRTLAQQLEEKAGKDPTALAEARREMIAAMKENILKQQPVHKRMQESVRKYEGQIAVMLTPEQQLPWEKHRLGKQVAEYFGRVIVKVPFTAEQNTRIADLIAAAAKTLSGLAGLDDKTRRAATEKLFRQVEELLTEKQKKLRAEPSNRVIFEDIQIGEDRYRIEDPQNFDTYGQMLDKMPGTAPAQP